MRDPKKMMKNVGNDRYRTLELICRSEDERSRDWIRRKSIQTNCMNITHLTTQVWSKRSKNMSSYLESWSLRRASKGAQTRILRHEDDLKIDIDTVRDEGHDKHTKSAVQKVHKVSRVVGSPERKLAGTRRHPISISGIGEADKRRGRRISRTVWRRDVLEMTRNGRR